MTAPSTVAHRARPPAGRLFAAALGLWAAAIPTVVAAGETGWDEVQPSPSAEVQVTPSTTPASSEARTTAPTSAVLGAVQEALTVSQFRYLPEDLPDPNVRYGILGGAALLFYGLPVLLLPSMLAARWRPSSAVAMCLSFGGIGLGSIAYLLLARITELDFLGGYPIPWYRDYRDLAWFLVGLVLILMGLVVWATTSKPRTPSSASGAA